MKKKLKVGVIGLGYQTQSEIIPALQLIINDIEVVSICDKDQ